MLIWCLYRRKLCSHRWTDIVKLSCIILVWDVFEFGSRGLKACCNGELEKILYYSNRIWLAQCSLNDVNVVFFQCRFWNELENSEPTTNWWIFLKFHYSKLNLELSELRKFVVKNRNSNLPKLEFRTPYISTFLLH